MHLFFTLTIHFTSEMGLMVFGKCVQIRFRLIEIPYKLYQTIAILNRVVGTQPWSHFWQWEEVQYTWPSTTPDLSYQSVILSLISSTRDLIS